MHGCDRIDRWLDDACSKIFWKSEREAVAEELRAHYEDACDALQKSGISVEDSQDLALRGMGNAEELADLLAEAHHSCWTFLWIFTRWLARISLVILIIFFLCFRLPYIDSLYIYDIGAWTTESWAQSENVPLQECNIEKTFSGYWWKAKEWARFEDVLWLDLTLYDSCLSVSDPVSGLDRVEFFVGTSDSEIQNSEFKCRSVKKFFTQCDYTLEIEDIPKNAAWAELRVKNTDFVLRIDLRGGDDRQ